MLKQAKFEIRNIDNLTNWENNPRSILEEDFERLKGQVEELGVYKTLLINQDNIVLGGNMRLRAFKMMAEKYPELKEVMCGIVDTADEGEMLKYALSDNDQAGVTDDMKLAEVWHLHPIDTKLYKVQSNVLRPLESIINPPDPTTLGGEGVDRSELDEDLDTYLQGDIKQIVLHFKADEFGEIISMLEELMKVYVSANHTDLITKIIREEYARNTANKEAA